MYYSSFHIEMIRHRAREVDRRAGLLGPKLAALAERPVTRAQDAVTVRLAAGDDAPELALIAELDSATLPAGPLLIGERGGRAVAALSLSEGAVIANPFLPSADVVALLQLRAHQLQASGGGRRRGRLVPVWRLLRAG